MNIFDNALSNLAQTMVGFTVTELAKAHPADGRVSVPENNGSGGPNYKNQTPAASHPVVSIPAPAPASAPHAAVSAVSTDGLPNLGVSPKYSSELPAQNGFAPYLIALAVGAYFYYFRKRK